MASTTARVSLEGAIPGFLASPCVFQLTVHRDGSLTGTVSPSDVQHLDCGDTISLFDGIATPNAASAELPQAPLYKVKFQLAKLTDLPGVIFYIDVEGELSLTAGLQGRWNVAGSLGRPDAMDPDRPFRLAARKELPAPRQRADEIVEPASVAVMTPLTQGSYTLRGATIADNGYMYRATWSLTFHAHGVLQGTSLESDNAPQLCRLDGSWTRTRIKLLMTYVVESAVGTYTYEGDVCEGGLRGRCVSTALPESANECGKFEFTCVEAVRRWNVEDHGQFPRAFNDAVRTCLLSSLHASRATRCVARLPSLLWREVFSFCGFDWF